MSADIGNNISGETWSAYLRDCGASLSETVGNRTEDLTKYAEKKGEDFFKSLRDTARWAQFGLKSYYDLENKKLDRFETSISTVADAFSIPDTMIALNNLKKSATALLDKTIEWYAKETPRDGVTFSTLFSEVAKDLGALVGCTADAFRFSSKVKVINASQKQVDQASMIGATGGSLYYGIKTYRNWDQLSGLIAKPETSGRSTPSSSGSYEKPEVKGKNDVLASTIHDDDHVSETGSEQVTEKQVELNAMKHQALLVELAKNVAKLALCTLAATSAIFAFTVNPVAFLALSSVGLGAGLIHFLMERDIERIDLKEVQI